MLLETVFTDLKKTVQSITVKLDGVAKTMETLDTRKDSDKFIAASLRTDTFNSYVQYSEEAIAKVITDVVLIKKYAEDKSLIPDDMRNAVLEEQRLYIKRTYDEKNNYYRKLAGLPDYDDLNFVYLTDDMVQTHGLNPDTPIHQLSEEDLLKIQKSGDFNRILEYNPTKKYLNYLGPNKIDIVTARQAKNFTLLRLPADVSESFYEDFSMTYEECRTYFMSVLYNREFGSRFDLYDNYMAMMILVMTIQRLLVNSFKYGIERDFYDLSSIRLLFDSYNVPFVENLPVELQRILVRNLNNLLHYKSTDKVLYDICSLLGFERINIYKYYLVKEHKLDENENPLFVFKEETDERTGEVRLVEDVEKMYSLYFQAVELRERNIALALSNSVGKMDYNQVVSNDVFWWDDDDTLKQQVYENEFNYVESKYINMNIMYKLTEMLFEIIYIFRMMVDKNDSTSNIMITLPRLFQQKELSLFHITVLLCALVAKKNRFAGNIIHTPSKTLSILGFNFDADFTAIREEVRKNPKLYDQRILQYIQNMDVYSASDVNNLYKNIRDLANFLVDRMGATRNRKRYQAYKKLYDTLMITDNVTTMFTKKDGQVAETFLEYLDDYDLTIGEFVRTADITAIPEHIEHILYRLNLALKDLRHLYIFNDSNNVTMEAIISLIKFFKSYTTDLNSFNILYLMDSRYFNMIKMLGEINHIEKMLSVKTNNLRTHYKDNSRNLVRLLRKQAAVVKETGFLKSTQRRKTKYKLKHVRRTAKVLGGTEKQRLVDILGLKASQKYNYSFKPEHRALYDISYKKEEPIHLLDKQMTHGQILQHEGMKPYPLLESLKTGYVMTEEKIARDQYQSLTASYTKDEYVTNYDKVKTDKFLNPMELLNGFDMLMSQQNTIYNNQALNYTHTYHAYKDMDLPSDNLDIKQIVASYVALNQADKLEGYTEIINRIGAEYSKRESNIIAASRQLFTATAEQSDRLINDVRHMSTEKSLNPLDVLGYTDMLQNMESAMSSGSRLKYDSDSQTYKDIVVPSDTMPISTSNEYSALISESERIEKYLDIVESVRTNYYIDGHLDLNKVSQQYVSQMMRQEYLLMHGRIKSRLDYMIKHDIGEFLETIDIPEVVGYNNQYMAFESRPSLEKEQSMSNRHIYTAKNHNFITVVTDKDFVLDKFYSDITVSGSMVPTDEIELNNKVHLNKEIESNLTVSLQDLSLASKSSDVVESVKVSDDHSLDIGLGKLDNLTIADAVKLTWDE